MQRAGSPGREVATHHRKEPTGRSAPLWCAGTRRGARFAARVAVVAWIWLVAACANIGSPEGGPRDYNPPRVVRTSPEAGALNFQGKKVEITFDEIVNIKDQQKKVVVSPTPKEQPLIRALGKKVTVEFRDTLEPATTYVIDFSNAIEDNNEGNPLDGYAFSFSTGSELDSLRVSGMVLRASDLEPMQHVLVGLHSNLAASAFTRSSPSWVSSPAATACSPSTTWTATSAWRAPRTWPSSTMWSSRGPWRLPRKTPCSPSTTASTPSWRPPTRASRPTMCC